MTNKEILNDRRLAMETLLIIKKSIVEVILITGSARSYTTFQTLDSVFRAEVIGYRISFCSLVYPILGRAASKDMIARLIPARFDLWAHLRDRS